MQACVRSIFYLENIKGTHNQKRMCWCTNSDPSVCVYDCKINNNSLVAAGILIPPHHKLIVFTFHKIIPQTYHNMNQLTLREGLLSTQAHKVLG